MVGILGVEPRGCFRTTALQAALAPYETIRPNPPIFFRVVVDEWVLRSTTTFFSNLCGFIIRGVNSLSTSAYCGSRRSRTFWAITPYKLATCYIAVLSYFLGGKHRIRTCIGFTPLVFKTSAPPLCEPSNFNVHRRDMGESNSRTLIDNQVYCHYTNIPFLNSVFLFPHISH